jgi:hypothetical protein
MAGGEAEDWVKENVIFDFFAFFYTSKYGAMIA